jgi:very-short-patch-repair endonuclease
MADRKKLGISFDSVEAPPALKKKGRGWEVSEKRLDALHDRARDMRRHSSPAHKALAARFAKANMGPYAFKRWSVVGSAIVDFNCHRLGMAIAIDEEGENEVISRRRDKSMEAVGIRVMRIKASDILDDMDAVLARITAGMRMRIADKQAARSEHQAGQERRGASRGRTNRTSNAED